MFCDRCVQRAVATISKVKANGQACTMHLCGHHTRQHHEQLEAEGWIIHVDDDANAWLPDELKKSGEADASQKTTI